MVVETGGIAAGGLQKAFISGFRVQIVINQVQHIFELLHPVDGFEYMVALNVGAQEARELTSILINAARQGDEIFVALEPSIVKVDGRPAAAIKTLRIEMSN